MSDETLKPPAKARRKPHVFVYSEQLNLSDLVHEWLHANGEQDVTRMKQIAERIHVQLSYGVGE